MAGEAEILRGVTFAVQAGEVFSVVGPSGAGKSTLLRTINRLVESTAGNIFLDGVPIEEINPLKLRRRIGMVFQLPALFGDTVEDTVLYGVRPPYLRTQALYWIGLVSAVLFAGAGLSLPALALGARWEDALKPAVLSSPFLARSCFSSFCLWIVGIVVHESGLLYPEAIIFTTTAPKSLHDFESEVRRARRLDRTDPPQFDPLRAEILEEPNPVAK